MQALLWPASYCHAQPTACSKTYLDGLAELICKGKMEKVTEPCLSLSPLLELCSHLCGAQPSLPACCWYSIMQLGDPSNWFSLAGSRWVLLQAWRTENWPESIAAGMLSWRWSTWGGSVSFECFGTFWFCSWRWGWCCLLICAVEMLSWWRMDFRQGDVVVSSAVQVIMLATVFWLSLLLLCCCIFLFWGAVLSILQWLDDD